MYCSLPSSESPCVNHKQQVFKGYEEEENRGSEKVNMVLYNQKKSLIDYFSFSLRYQCYKTKCLGHNNVNC